MVTAKLAQAAYNLTRGGAPVASKVMTADDARSRSRGLLGRDGMEPGEALWIVPCPMIHTFFMRFPIDVVFLDKSLRAVRVLERLKPWRVSPWVWRAHSCLELPAGALAGGVRPGDQLALRPVEAGRPI